MDTLQITTANLLKGLDGEIQLVFGVGKHLQDKAQTVAQNATERLRQGKEVALAVEQIRKRRSLDANAYFHVLCDKIAEATKLSMDDVKVNMVVNYGTPKYIVSVPSDAVISDLWAYSRFIGEVDGQAQYMLYKQTHTLSSSEMARLINGAIREAQQLGIETLTPQELAQMQSNWDAKHNGN